MVGTGGRKEGRKEEEENEANDQRGTLSVTHILPQEDTHTDRQSEEDIFVHPRKVKMSDDEWGKYMFS